jgi:hypothetical protein
MLIRFIEDRILLDQSRVNAGEGKDFPDEEAAAFVNNGVAEFVSAPANGGEVIDHG